MKIALLHDFIGTGTGGAERVLAEFHGLFPDAPVYTAYAERSATDKLIPGADIRTSSLQKSRLRNRPEYVLLRMPQAIEEFDFNQFDVLLSSSGAYSHGAITGPDTFHLCYCHSPMRYAWDWHAEYLNARAGNGMARFVAEGAMSRLRIWDAVSAKRVDRWIANSQTVAARISHFYRQPATVIYPPVDTAFFDPALAAATPDKPYAVSVSRLSGTKRLDWAIAAAKQAGIDLVIAGEGPDRPRLERLADSSVRFAGNVTESEKRDLLAGASCFLFPAEDDFGIAPVEALAMGVPVVAFGKGGATEYVMDGKNGMVFPEPDTISFGDVLSRFVSDGVSMDKGEIRTTALAFSAERFRTQITQAVQDAHAN